VPGEDDEKLYKVVGIPANIRTENLSDVIQSITAAPVSIYLISDKRERRKHVGLIHYISSKNYTILYKHGLKF
jgi:hypothetical protein